MTSMLHRILDQRGLLSRRDTLVLGAGAVAAVVAPSMPPAAAQEEAERHGISTFGDLKYAADFKHFDYVNPNAPKGGIFSQIGPSAAFNQNLQTFNSLNSYILRGDAAQGMENTFATLMPPPKVGLTEVGLPLATGKPPADEVSLMLWMFAPARAKAAMPLAASIGMLAST